MTTRNTPLRTRMRYLAIAIPLAACSPPPGDVKPQDQQSSDHAPHSFFGRLFGNEESLVLPEAGMVTRDTVCAPYLGEVRLADDEQATVDVAAGDLWLRLREGMMLDHSVSNARIDKEIAFYRKHPRLLQLVAERASLYMYAVVEELERRDMPMELALIPVMESAYNPMARGPGGATGMWQFMPGTARVHGLTVSNNFDERRDVVASTRVALDYLGKLHRKLGNDWLSAVTAYNTGELNVAAAIKRNERQGKATDYWHLSLRNPTSQYAPRLIALAKIFAEPQRYGIKLPPIADTPVFASITMDPRANLLQAASMAGVSAQKLFELNPGLNRHALPRSTYTLHVPYASKPQFELAVTQLRSRAPAVQQQYAAARAPQKAAAASANGNQVYVVKSGDNLWRISRNFKVAAADIVKWNQLSSDTLRAGQKLTLQLEN